MRRSAIGPSTTETNREAEAVTRNLAAAVIACLYMALSAWLVGAVGEAHRSTLRKSAAGQSAMPSLAPAVAAKNEESIRPEPSSAAEHRPAEKLVARAKEPPLPLPVPAAGSSEPTPKAMATPPKPRPSNSVAPASAPAPAKTPVTIAAAPRLQLIHPFFGSPEAQKKWDLSNLTPEQEKELGLELNGMVMLFYRRSRDGTLQERVEDAAEQLLAARSRKDSQCNLVVLESDAVNAFSHPGGYIYVTRGLLKWIGEDDTFALQFALAHEIFHVDRQHALRCLQDPGVKALPYGTLTLFYLLIFPRGYYPDEMDLEADAWALRQLQKFGATPRECLSFLRRMKGYAEASGFGTGHEKPESGKSALLLDNHYRAHPAAFKRLKKLEALVKGPPVQAK
jgi:hypothetical protein